MKIEVKKSPYTSKLGGDIDITFSTDDGVVIQYRGQYKCKGFKAT